MSKIIIAGAGCGGIVAAVKLAQGGHDVTVFERSKREDMGHPQTDAFELDTFDYAGIPAAPYFKRGKNILTFVPSDRAVTPLTVPDTDVLSYLVDRKELAEYLLSLAEEAGAKLIFETAVEGALTSGNRVIGIKTDTQGDIYGDLVIDSCGVFSPLRSSLPDFTGVDREIKKYDVLYTYRGYFNRLTDKGEPRTNYNIYLNDNGNVGFNWLVTELNRVDALICRFRKISDSDVLETLRRVHEENGHMGTELVYGGTHAVIPVCQPLAILVADGYAAVGDSAFMTYSVKGSGITYSMKAGAMLARTVMNDTLGFYTAETLWDYEKTFFKEIGFSACRIALMKNMLPYMTAEQVSDLFRQNIVTTEELAKLFEEKLDAVLNAKGIQTVREKMRLVRDNALLKDVFSSLAVWMGKFAVVEAAFPNKYDYQDTMKWCKRYNEFFDSIRAE